MSVANRNNTVPAISSNYNSIKKIKYTGVGGRVKKDLGPSCNLCRMTKLHTAGLYIPCKTAHPYVSRCTLPETSSNRMHEWVTLGVTAMSYPDLLCRQALTHYCQYEDMPVNRDQLCDTIKSRAERLYVRHSRSYQQLFTHFQIEVFFLGEALLYATCIYPLLITAHATVANEVILNSGQWQYG